MKAIKPLKNIKLKLFNEYLATPCALLQGTLDPH